MSVNDKKDSGDVVDYHDQVAIRKAKLTNIREQRNAYPNNIKPNSYAAEILKKYENANHEELECSHPEHLVCGRIMNRRIMGKASFLHLQDFSGKIQAYITRDDIGAEQYIDFKSWDLGDIIAIKGYAFRTKTNEITLHATEIDLLTKSLHPLPDKYHGLAEKELCYRKRYLDILTNEATRDVFVTRTKIITSLRNHLLSHDYLEVETPMMHVLPGGAAARPFKTHHNALDQDLFMRIAPELFLKRLVIGGFDRVFEINRNFRNEGLSTRHNPEFTMVEFYQAYADYRDLMTFIESMFKTIVKGVFNEDKVEFNGNAIDFAAPFNVITMHDAILRYNPDMQPYEISDLEKATAVATSLGISVLDEYGYGRVILDIFEKTVEKKLIQPTFITEYPTEVSPLSRKNDINPDIVDRFELFIGGQEIANGFSELNDPEDQASRFEKQAKEHEAGDQEAMLFDSDYVEALEHGLPPTAGAGIGIDRLVMLLTNSSSIRDVILFPLMKPLLHNESTS